MILAHKDNKGNKQSLEKHSFNVAVQARESAQIIKQGDILFLLGLYHDLGKANTAFQDKLEIYLNKHVDHSSAGARYLFQKIQTCLKDSFVQTKDRILFQEIIAYVISAHHGMYDIPLHQAERFAFNKLRHRIIEGIANEPYQKDILPFAQKLEDELSAYGYRDLNDLIEKAFGNYQQAWSQLNWFDESERE